MRKSALLLIALAILAATAIAVHFRNEQRQHSGLNQIRARYHYTADLAYEDIRLIDSRLIITYLPESFRSNIRSKPELAHYTAYRTEDLKKAEFGLTRKQRDQFTALVKRSGFCGVKSPVGAASYGRFYAHTVFVDIDGQAKTVEYRSSPEAPPMPRAFGDVRNWLRNTAKGNCPDF